MSEENYILCKIAEEASNPAEYTFSLLNEKWQRLPYIPDSFEHLLEFKKQSIFQFTKTTTNGKTYLAVQLKSNGSFNDNGKVFSLILKDYVPEISMNITQHETFDSGDEAAEGETKLLKKYLTTSLYEALDSCHSIAIDTQNYHEIVLGLPENFVPTLRPYQEKSVRWLLRRECDQQRIPPFFNKFVTKDNSCTVYVHKYCNYLQLAPPPDILMPPGGVLADEMGLGKTVEVLALILLNPRPHVNTTPNFLHKFDLAEPAEKRIRKEKEIFCICGRKNSGNVIECQGCHKWQHVKCVQSATKKEEIHNYFCPACWSHFTEKELLETGATLIVTPYSIRMQWLLEIRRHIKPTPQVLVFEGTVGKRWISPKILASYDIVLTDYNVLRREIYHTKDNESTRPRRNPPRFMRMTSPLLMLEWWRVCIDEAQVVESNTSNISVMVRHLPAINRWAVTGTPIQRSIDDLLPLLQFFGFSEVCIPEAVWPNLVQDYMLHHDNPQKTKHALIEVLQLCMWRTSKQNIFNELGIPPQTQVVHRIDLSDLEKLYYDEEHEKCRGRFNETVAKYINRTDCKSVAISPRIMKLILFPLLKMRQCCTMPVLVNEKQVGQVGNQKVYMQPKELMPYMKSQNELECKSELRTMASSYNGKAGVHFLRGEYNNAIRNYEQVLKLATDYKQFNLSVDSLLQIHALYNIQQVYMEIQKSQQVSSFPEMTDAKMADYKEKYNALEWKYLEPYVSNLISTQNAYKAALELQRKSIHDLGGNLIDFLADLSVIIRENPQQLEEPLLFKIIQDGMMNNVKIFEIHSISSLLYVIKTWYDKVENLLKNILVEIDALQYFIDNVRPSDQIDAGIRSQITQFVENVYNCHLSQIRKNPSSEENAMPSFVLAKHVKKKDNLCKLCKLSYLLNKFECLLFNKTLDVMTNYVEGDQGPSLEAFLLKATFTFMRLKKRDHPLLINIDAYIDSLRHLPNISKKLIKFWIELEFTVKAYDELDMCKMRVGLSDDKSSEYCLNPDEVDSFYYEQEVNLIQAQHMFTNKLARLKYINHLQSEIELFCPICHSKDEPRYVMLQCGHVACVICFNMAKERDIAKVIRCSVCRDVHKGKILYYLTRATGTVNASSDIPVVGTYSSKIMYIVQTVLKLKNDHCDTETCTPKILIFSQWEPILQAIANALKENGVSFRHKWSPKAVDEFKNAEMGVTCFLLLISRGGKGLNLIEATHVFLVEPLLNPGEELQAIGRVHRFGQTKPTTVHRFIVNNTIEDNIYNVVSENSVSQENWEFKNLTVDTIKNLFVLKKVDDEGEEANANEGNS